MTKKELEVKILELEKKITDLEIRNQIFCVGHYCNCHQHNSYPTYPNYPYYGPIWVSTPTTTICGTISGGSTGILSRATN